MLGCSLFCANHVPRVPFAGFHLQKLNSSHSHTTLPRGGVSRDSWASQVSERRRTGPVCHSRWEDVVCGAPLGIRVSAHWASWADSLRMINSRHPGVAATMVRCLVGPTDSRHFSAAASCRAVLRESGFDAPEWETLLTSFPRALAALIPGALAVPEQGWQHVASLVVEERFVNTVVVPRASPAHWAVLRSQGGPLSGLPFTTLLLSPLLRFDSHLFRVLLLRRSPPSSPTVFPRLPVWPSTRLPWPSPCKLLKGRGSWEARLRTVCCRLGLPQGRRQSQRMCSCATSTCPSVPWTNAGSK